MQHSPKCTRFSEVPAWEKSIRKVPHNHELWRYLDSRGPFSVNGSVGLPSVCVVVVLEANLACEMYSYLTSDKAWKALLHARRQPAHSV